MRICVCALHSERVVALCSTELTRYRFERTEGFVSQDDQHEYQKRKKLIQLRVITVRVGCMRRSLAFACVGRKPLDTRLL